MSGTRASMTSCIAGILSAACVINLMPPTPAPEAARMLSWKEVDAIIGGGCPGQDCRCSSGACGGTSDPSPNACPVYPTVCSLIDNNCVQLTIETQDYCGAPDSSYPNGCSTVVPIPIFRCAYTVSVPLPVGATKCVTTKNSVCATAPVTTDCGDDPAHCIAN